MGAAKTKTVGGGTATPVANDWNNFLAQGLKTGTFGGSTNGTGGTSGTGGASASTPQTGVGATIDQLLKGGSGVDFGNKPDFTGATFNPNATNLDLSKYQFNPNTMNLDQLMKSGFKMGSGIGGFNGPQAGAGYAGTSATGVPDFMGNMTQLGKVDMNDPAFAALNQKLTQDNALALANTRERFGGNALNSGASLAEAQFNAQANPAKVLAMQQLQAQMRGLNLADYQGQEQALQGRLGLSSQSQLGNRGISSNESIANAGNATQASIANANLGAQYGQMGLQGQGQILDYLLGAGNLGLNAANSGATNALNAFNANQQSNQWNNQNQFNNAQMQNQFNQNMFGQTSQNALGAAQLGQNAQMGALGHLFGGYQQSNALGTPQAQTVQTQPWWAQALNAAGQIANIGATFVNPFKGANPANTGQNYGSSPLSQMAPNIYGGINPANAGGFGIQQYQPQYQMPIQQQQGYNPFAFGR